MALRVHPQRLRPAFVGKDPFDELPQGSAVGDPARVDQDRTLTHVLTVTHEVPSATPRLGQSDSGRTRSARLRGEQLNSEYCQSG